MEISDRGFLVESGNIYETIPILYRQWYLSFDVKLAENTSGQKNIVQIGKGGNWQKYGDRTPFIQYLSLGELYINSAVNGRPNYAYLTNKMPTDLGRQDLKIYKFETIFLRQNCIFSKNRF